MTDNQQASESMATPGALLIEARVAAGLSLREVADKLHLHPSQVEALEKDDYLYLTGDIFCKGYLRSYGKLLNLDHGVLMKGYQAVNPFENQSAKKDAGIINSLQQPVKVSGLQYWFAAALLLIIALLWALNSNEHVAEPAVSEPQATIIDESGRSHVAAPETLRLDPADSASVTSVINRKNNSAALSGG